MIFHRAIGVGSLLFAALAWSEATKIEGLIKGRSGATMIIQSKDAQVLTVVLTDDTEVGQTQGVFKSRRKEMSMASLIPGLKVQVEAELGANNQLVAKAVKFTGDDLKRAEAIQAGLHETRLENQQQGSEIKQTQADIEKHRRDLDQQRAALAKQNQELEKQNQALKEEQAQNAAQQKKIAENRAAISAAIARFGQLDDYYILDEVTLYFGNGKADLDPKYQPELQKLVAKAKTVQGYMIEIKGYASSAGSSAVNQKLSEDRADIVATYLLQECHIPPTNLLAPAAMGESQQVGNASTSEGQSKNRRVVVRILQNKGVAGAITGG